MYYEGDRLAIWKNDEDKLISRFTANYEEYSVTLELKDLPGGIHGYEVLIDNVSSESKDEFYSHVFGAIAAKYEEEKTSIFFFDINGLDEDTTERFMSTCSWIRSRKGGMYYIARTARDTQLLLSRVFFKHTHPYWVSEWNEALVAFGSHPFES